MDNNGKLTFLHDDMDVNEQNEVLIEEYLKLQKREDRGLKLIQSLKDENDKMDQTNKMGLTLVDNLKKQIEKYQNNDSFKIGDDEHDLASWKSRYESEKRTSQYLRAECEDLQNEIEELKENKHKETNDKDDNESELLDASLAIANQAWMEEITALLEQFKDSNTTGYNLTDLRHAMQTEVNKKKESILLSPNNNNRSNDMDYKSMYMDAVQSKLQLLEQTSKEIQNLRQIIFNHNRNEVYQQLFDRIARYHNLDGQEDTLFQLMIDAELRK